MMDQARIPAKAMKALKLRILDWGQEAELFIFLDNNQDSTDPYGKYCWIAGAGTKAHLRIRETDDADPFILLKEFRQHHNGWLLGYLSYDLKNCVEDLSSSNHSKHGFSLLSFFKPDNLITCAPDGNAYLVTCATPGLLKRIMRRELKSGPTRSEPGISMITIPSADSYKANFDRFMKHIRHGDIYEVNYCLEFSAQADRFDPVNTYHRLCALSSTPFSSFVKDGDEYLLSASPERFLLKQGDTLLSQPMKGTASRSSDPVTDEHNRDTLLASEKERSENIMITDLVRNDLGRSAVIGSVRVPELCKVIPFRNVWQMISTVTCELNPGTDPVDAIRNAFPMGSMTGAPKVRALQLIEETETFRRGLFSGSVGYFSPDDDFDFNVVIRSIMYSGRNGFLSFPAGGAITASAEWDKEYRECMLKASTMHEAVTGKALPFD